MNFQFSIFNFKFRQRGFTLVEMIVSLMIFSIVAVVALAALVKIIDANNKAQTIQAAVTSLSFSLDAMSREIRTGSNIYCVNSNDGSFDPTDPPPNSSNCPLNQSSGQNLIVFQSARASTAESACRLWYAYFFTGTVPVQLEKAEQPSNSTDCDDSFSSDSYTSVVPSNVTLTAYQLSVSTDQYPLVFVELSGTAGNKEQTKTYFSVQTAMSPRTP